MDGSTSKSLSLSLLQRRILEEEVAQRQCAQGLATRARIVLLAGDGWGVLPTARQLHVDVKTVRLWRRRWTAVSAGWEQDGQDWQEKVWREKIQRLLRDAPRSGAPCTFQPEHVCQIIALACKKPGDLALPISHWSATDLQREVLKQKIVPAISARQVGRFLKRRTSSRTACVIT
jgi:hypothetical protein